MKFLHLTRKKIFLTIIFFIILAFVAMHFGTRGFVYSDEVPVENQPVHFKINPILWLPSWYFFKGEISDSTILISLLYTFPYWLIISYLLSSVMLKNDN